MSFISEESCLFSITLGFQAARANAHWNLAYDNEVGAALQWVHFTAAHVEAAPILGALVALIDTWVCGELRKQAHDFPPAQSESASSLASRSVDAITPSISRVNHLTPAAPVTLETESPAATETSSATVSPFSPESPVEPPIHFTLLSLSAPSGAEPEKTDPSLQFNVDAGRFEPVSQPALIALPPEKDRLESKGEELVPKGKREVSLPSMAHITLTAKLLEQTAFIALREGVATHLRKSMGIEPQLFYQAPEYGNEILREFITEQILLWLGSSSGAGQKRKYHRRAAAQSITLKDLLKDKTLPLRGQKDQLSKDQFIQLHQPIPLDESVAVQAQKERDLITKLKLAVKEGLIKARLDIASGKRDLMEQFIGVLPVDLAKIVVAYTGNWSRTPIPDVQDILPYEVESEVSAVVTKKPGSNTYFWDSTIRVRLSETQERIAQAPSPPPNIIFLADRSGSMDGVGVNTLREALPRVVQDQLPDEARVGISTFDSTNETPFPLEFLGPTKRAMVDALVDTSETSILHPRGGTVILPGYVQGLVDLLSSAIHDQEANVLRNLILFSLTDGATEPIPDRYIAEIMEFLFESEPELAELLGIFPGALGNGAKIEQLKSLRGGFGEVFKIQLGSPQQLRAQIDDILKRRGYIANRAAVEFEAPAGCKITHIVGYKIDAPKRKITIPVPPFLSGETLELHARIEGEVRPGIQMKVTVRAFDQIARLNRVDSFFSNPVVLPVDSEAVHLFGTADLIDSEMAYLDALHSVHELSLKEAIARLRTMIIPRLAQHPVAFQPRIISLQSLVSSLVMSGDAGFDNFVKRAVAHVVKVIQGVSPELLSVMIREEVEWSALKGGYVARSLFDKGERLEREPKVTDKTLVSDVGEVARLLEQEILLTGSGKMLQRTAPERALTMAMRYFAERGYARIAEREIAREILEREPDLPFLFRFAAGEKSSVVMVMRHPTIEGDTLEQLFLASMSPHGVRLSLVNALGEKEMTFTPEEMIRQENVVAIRNSLLKTAVEKQPSS